jgi:hypothetical protein
MPDSARDREFQRSFRAARRQPIPIYFAAINTDRNLEPNTIGGDEYQNLRKLFPSSSVPAKFLTEVRLRMEELADISGGAVLYPRMIEDVVSVYDQIGRTIGTSYSLGYTPTNHKTNGSFHRIHVKTRRHDLTLTQSRTGYTAK